MKYLIPLLFLALPVTAAELLRIDPPYFVFNDSGIIRYCLPPAKINDLATCWANGKKTECQPLEAEQGYIDCGSG